MKFLLYAGIMLMVFGIGSYVAWMVQFGKPYETAMGHIIHGASLILIWCAFQEIASEIKKHLTNPKPSD